MALVVAVPVILGMIIRKFADNFISSKTSFIDKVTGTIKFYFIWILSSLTKSYQILFYTLTASLPN